MATKSGSGPGSPFAAIEAILAFTSAGKLERSELFLQTKFTFAGGQDHRLPYDPSAPLHLQVWQSFEVSLEHLTQVSPLCGATLVGNVRDS